MGTLADLIIFTEASPQVGHGHVGRCLALADEASRRGLKVMFPVADQYTADIVHDGGHQTCRDVVENTPFIIRDFRDGSAAADVARERASGSRVMLLDERGEARTCATIVTDTFMTPHRARQFVHAPEVAYLYGFEYAPLRSQFLELAMGERPKPSLGGCLFVAFGGSDPHGITRRYLQALDDCGFRGPATIVVEGTPAAYQEASRIAATWRGTVIYQNITNMAVLMKNACLVATKVGMTLLESFCLGKGCVFIEPTPAHVNLEEELARHYPTWPALEFGLADDVDFIKAASQTMDFLADHERVQGMGRVAANLVDGRGTSRLIDSLLGAS